ncbi:MAG: ABC transporter ATP-binding protein/permease [Oscillospiraceae bacterium]|nr:ABC transporter ATP-binding protein/permease [Oscillospiraceae bacterium]
MRTLQISDKSEAVGIKENIKALRWIIGRTRKHLWMVGIVAVIGAVISGCYIWFALLSRQIIDAALGSQPRREIISIALVIVSVLLLQVVLSIISNNIRIRALCRMEYNLKNTVFISVTKKKYKELTAFHTGELLNRLMRDAENIALAVTELIVRPVSYITRIAAGVAVLITISPVFTLVFAGCAAVLLIFGRTYKKRIKPLYKKCLESEGVIRGYTAESLDNMVVIKSFGAADMTLKKIMRLQGKNYKARLRRNVVNNIASTLSYLVFTAGYYIALTWGAFAVSGGAMSLGTLVSLLQIISQVQAPIKSASGLMPQFYEMTASTERLIELEELEEESAEQLPEPKSNAVKDRSFNSLNIGNISFCYNNTNDKNVLDNFSMVLKKGEIVGISGLSGIGKTTIFKLILGLYSPDSGRMYFDTEGGTIDTDERTRRYFGFVPQGNLIFSGSLRDNIIYAAGDNSTMQEQELADIISVCRLEQLAADLKDGIDTEVGERGFSLSEGQIQRVAIARAIASKAPILLLDEFTSALDQETELSLFDGIKKLGRSCIIISHKKGTLAHCDRVVTVG